MAWDFGSGYSSSYGHSYHGRPRTQQQSLLQVVIRKLVDSFDDEERQQHYHEIKADLDIAEENLDTLVQDHKEQLHRTLATFGKIDSTIKNSQAKVHMLKSSLQVCKTQLRCKREELKRLWLDGVKYKKMLKLIDEIDQMKHVPDLLQQHRTDKKYYEATELLKNSVAMLEGELMNIDALKDLRQELKQQKETFHLELIDELQYQLYTKATGSAYQTPPTPVKRLLNHSRSPSDTSNTSSPGPPKRPSVKHTRTPSKSAGTELVVQSPPPIIECSQEVVETDQLSRSDSSNPEYLGSLVESLSMLGRVPEMLEGVQRRMKRELLLIVERTSIRITQLAEEEGVSSNLRPSPTCENPRFLHSLLEMCFRQFEDVVSAHSILLEHLNATKKTYKGTYELYLEADVWAGIQQILREMLEIYLAVDEEKPQTAMSAFSAFMVAGHVSIAPFSRRKVPAKGRKQPMFRFDNSRHALSVSSYIKEQRDKELASQIKSGKVSQMEHHFEDSPPSISQHMVCRASARNITVMYAPVKDFTLRIEDAMQLQVHSHCDLYHFLQDFVENRFLDAIALEYRDKMEAALKPEAKDVIISDAKSLRGTGKNGLLNSCMILWKAVAELHQLVNDMPMYSSHFLSTIIELLQMYLEEYQVMYREHTATTGAPAIHGHGDKFASQKLPVISAKWVRDDGIIRLLKSFTSWQKLQGKKTREFNETTLLTGKDSLHFKETENLLASLGSEIKHKSDILQDNESLKILVVLHESLEWLGEKLKVMLEALNNWGEGTDGGSFSKRVHRPHSTQEEEFVRDNEQQTHDLINNQFRKLIDDIISLSEMCVLILHLEVRAHCFYYLMPTLKNTSYVCDNEVSDADAGVKELAVDLKTFRLVTAGVLTSEKQKYLFNGIGHLLSAIFINSTQYLTKININGVKKMCRNIQHMQSCLSKITSVREKDLDLAQKYFAMLYVNEEEFLKLVMEQGKVFTHIDYKNALILLSRSQVQHNEIRLQKNLEKLGQMFDDDAC